jgi:hypothetical protein
MSYSRLDAVKFVATQPFIGRGIGEDVSTDFQHDVFIIREYRAQQESQARPTVMEKRVRAGQPIRKY